MSQKRAPPAKPPLRFLPDEKVCAIEFVKSVLKQIEAEYRDSPFQATFFLNVKERLKYKLSFTRKYFKVLAEQFIKKHDRWRLHNHTVVKKFEMIFTRLSGAASVVNKTKQQELLDHAIMSEVDAGGEAGHDAAMLTITGDCSVSALELVDGFAHYRDTDWDAFFPT